MKGVSIPKFRDIPQITTANYNVNIMWPYLEKWIEDNQINMNPDFQREYIWSQKQKEQYIEWVLKGGRSGLDIYFNHPGWFKSFEGEMVIVDGKQRVNAALEFLHNTVKVYGYYFKEYKDKYNSTSCLFSVNVADLESRAEILKWYIDINTGGTIHTENEIKNVKKLLKEEIKQGDTS